MAVPTSPTPWELLFELHLYSLSLPGSLKMSPVLMGEALAWAGGGNGTATTGLEELMATLPWGRDQIHHWGDISHLWRCLHLLQYFLSGFSLWCDVISAALPHTFLHPSPRMSQVSISSQRSFSFFIFLAEEPALIQALGGGYPSPLPRAAGE